MKTIKTYKELIDKVLKVQLYADTEKGNSRKVSFSDVHLTKITNKILIFERKKYVKGGIKLRIILMQIDEIKKDEAQVYIYKYLKETGTETWEKIKLINN